MNKSFNYEKEEYLNLKKNQFMAILNIIHPKEHVEHNNLL